MEQVVEGGGVTEHQDLVTFMAVASDVAVKDQMDLMSRSWFSLTANRTDPIEYSFDDRRSKRKETVRITGSQEHGIATIFDQDLLIFVISQLVAANRKGLQASRRVRFTPYQFFAWMNRTPTGSAAPTMIVSPVTTAGEVLPSWPVRSPLKSRSISWKRSTIPSFPKLGTGRPVLLSRAIK